MVKSRVHASDSLICSCNNVSRSAIVAAIDRGACTLAHIFDATWAGCGPCGGSCQPEILRVLRERVAISPVKDKP